MENQSPQQNNQADPDQTDAPNTDQPPLSPSPGSPSVPPKKGWLTPKKIAIIIAVIVILMMFGGASSNRKNNSTSTNTDSTKQTIPQTNINSIGQAPANTNAPANEKSYFNTVRTHLDTIGKLSQTMYKSCSPSFPVPEPCQSDIKAYQQELSSTQADMDKVSAPTSFSEADSTLRSALATDIEATNEALDALQTKNWAKWFSALSKHAQAGQKLNQAGAEALEVLQS